MDCAQQAFAKKPYRCQLHPSFTSKPSNFHSFGAGGIPAPVASPSLLEKSGELAPRNPPQNAPPTISYRPVQPSDLEILQEIHEALFPIKYETEFFLNVVHGKGVVAWAAIDTSRSDRHGDELVGFVTARIAKATDVEAEDMLGYDMLKTDRTLIYILTLGVVKPYRNFGIASALVWQVIEYASFVPTCRAVYLHVISYNKTAILFYQKNDFQCLRRLSNFYHISGCYYDAYLYIYYVNGGRSPCSALDFLAAARAFVRNTFATMVSKLFHHSNDRVVQKSRLMEP